MLKKIGLAAAFSVIALGAQAETLKDGGYVGCESEDYLDEFISAAVKTDEQAMQFLLTSYKCVALSSKFGQVTVLDRGFSVSKVRVYAGNTGVELWTVNEAIQR